MKKIIMLVIAAVAFVGGSVFACDLEGKAAMQAIKKRLTKAPPGTQVDILKFVPIGDKLYVCGVIRWREDGSKLKYQSNDKNEQNLLFVVTEKGNPRTVEFAALQGEDAFDKNALPACTL